MGVTPLNNDPHVHANVRLEGVSTTPTRRWSNLKVTNFNVKFMKFILEEP